MTIRFERDEALAARIPARTVFANRVVPVPARPTKSTGLYVLKAAKSNTKLSALQKPVFKKGPWRGMSLYTLTLEERATCPSTCEMYVRCYGNRMLNALRYKHGPALERAVRLDVQALARKHPAGFVVRLHVLGDFYAVRYVELWAKLVREHPQLHIFGYTHRSYGTPIGDAVTRLVVSNPGRVSILRSDGFVPEDPLPRAISTPAGTTTPHPLTKVVCPEQTGRVASCLDCGLCLNGHTSVSFVDHGVTPHKLVQLARAG